MATSATVATAHEARLSIETEGECCIQKEPGSALLQDPRDFTTYANALLHCAKMRGNASVRNFLPFVIPTTKLIAARSGVAFFK
jgi:hypothetical protein